MILYVAHSGELGIVFRHVQHLVDHNLLNEFPFINRAMERAGIKVEAGKALPAKFILRDKLAPFAEDTLRAVLQRFRDGALSKGIRPALVLLEIPSDSPSRPKSFDRLLSIGESIKLPVLDLQGSFSSKLERNSLWIAPWDDHTNAEGHRLLADRLFSLLLKERLIPTQAPARSSEPQPQE